MSLPGTAVRAVWLVEFYKKPAATPWSFEVLVAKRFGAVEATMRQWTALDPDCDSTYWPLSEATDDAVAAAVAHRERMPIIGDACDLSEERRPFSTRPVETDGSLQTIVVATEAKEDDVDRPRRRPLRVVCFTLAVPPCDCDGIRTTVRLGTSSPSPVRSRQQLTERSLRLIVATDASCPRDFPACAESTDVADIDACAVAADVKRCLMPLVRRSSGPSEGEMSAFDVLHRNTRSRSKQGCHGLGHTTPTPWQTVADALIATRFPNGRPTTALPDVLPTVAELCQDALADLEDTLHLAKWVDARFAVRSHEELQSSGRPLRAAIVSLDVLSAALYGRNDTSDVLHAGTHIFCDMNAFDGSRNSADRRLVLSSGRWGNHPDADDTGLSPKTVSHINVNADAATAPRAVLLRRAAEVLPERLPADVPQYAAPTRRGIEALVMQMPALPWVQRAGVAPLRIPAKAATDQVAVANDLAARAALIFGLDASSKSLAPVPPGGQIAISAPMPMPLVAAALDSTKLRSPLLTSLKAQFTEHVSYGVERHTVTLLLRLQTEMSDAVAAALGGAPSGSGSVAEFAATSAFASDPPGRSKLTVPLHSGRGVLVARFNVILRVHDAGVGIVGADLKANVGTIDISEDGNVHWGTPPWVKRANGFEFKATGTIDVSRSTAAAGAPKSPLRLSADLDFVLVLLSADGSVMDRADGSPVSTVELLPMRCVRTHELSPPQTSSPSKRATAQGVQQRAVAAHLQRAATVTSAVAPSFVFSAFMEPPPIRQGAGGVLGTPIGETLQSDDELPKLRALAALPPSAEGSHGGFTVWNAFHPKCRVI